MLENSYKARFSLMIERNTLTFTARAHVSMTPPSWRHGKGAHVDGAGHYFPNEPLHVSPLVCLHWAALGHRGP